MEKLKVKDIVLTGLMAAITFVAAMVIHIPNGINGFIHPGDVVVLLAPILIGKKKGIFAAAFGMMLVDLIGYPIYAPFTFVIKGVMAWISYTIYIKRDTIGNKVIAFSTAAIFMVVSYFLTGTIITYFINKEADSIGKALIAGSTSILGDSIQGIVAVVLSIIVLNALSRNKK